MSQRIAVVQVIFSNNLPRAVTIPFIAYGDTEDEARNIALKWRRANYILPADKQVKNRVELFICDIKDAYRSTFIALGVCSC